ncbi:MAG: DUF3592 domain-containing protein [Planctomycetota bacterium]
MMKTTMTPTERGCAVLFALPFAASGVWLAVWLVVGVWSVIAAQSWIPTPATLTRFESYQNVDHTTTITTSYTVEYSYSFGGRTYTGHNLFVSGSCSSGRSFSRKHDRVDASNAGGEPVECFVNPADPTQAVLDRAFDWYTAAIALALALVFGGIGFGVIATLFGWISW